VAGLFFIVLYLFYYPFLTSFVGGDLVTFLGVISLWTGSLDPLNLRSYGLG
jgi:hypothetical protein